MMYLHSYATLKGASHLISQTLFFDKYSTRYNVCFTFMIFLTCFSYLTDPPPLPNPFFTDDAFSSPSSSGSSFSSTGSSSFSSGSSFSNSDSFSDSFTSTGSSSSFVDSFGSDQSFPFSGSSQPSVVSVNTVFDQPETFRTTGGQARYYNIQKSRIDINQYFLFCSAKK